MRACVGATAVLVQSVRGRWSGFKSVCPFTIWLTVLWRYFSVVEPQLWGAVGAQKCVDPVQKIDRA